MVVVTSAPANFQRRQAIRESWAKDQEDSDTEVLFLLGKQQDAIQQAHIFYESLQNGDIIQEDFEDAYHNLSVKSMMMLKWFLRTEDVLGMKPNYLLKTDDDMYINLQNLVRVVARNKGKLLLTGCMCC